MGSYDRHAIMPHYNQYIDEELTFSPKWSNFSVLQMSSTRTSKFRDISLKAIFRLYKCFFSYSLESTRFHYTGKFCDIPPKW